MDAEPVEFDSIQLFDLSPETFAWRAPIPRQIEQRRAAMADVLIFDILLSAGGVRHPDSLYPPRDANTLHELLDAIEDTTYDGLKKDCLIYFLLKWHKDGREERFQEDRCIPPQFVALADAYWFLDSGEDVPRAISLLSDARLNRDYTSKIIQAIALEKADANALVMRYVRAAKPPLTDPDDIDAYSIALAETSLLEAWQYQRTFPEKEAVRARIFRNVLNWCLSPKPRAKQLTQLLSFPLSTYEQSLLHEFALKPPEGLPASSIPVIQDLAFVRLIHSGQLTAAVKLDRQFAITPVRGTFGGKAAQERKQTIDDIMSIMSVPERQLLELELEQLSQNADSSTLPSGSAADLSMSWEHVRTPLSKGSGSSKSTMSSHAANLHELLVPPISQRSGAPRFGGPIPRKASASSAFMATRNMFDTMAKQTSSQSPLLPTPTTPVIASIQAPATGYLPSQLSSGVKRKDPVSLFDTVGSATRTPNAFFQPSPTSTGAKRPTPEPEPATEEPPAVERVTPEADLSTGSALDVSTMITEAPEPDAGVDADVDENADADADVEMPQTEAIPEIPTQPEQTLVEDPPQQEFSVSVFRSRRPRPSVGTGENPSPKARSPGAPPGAFEPEAESDGGDTHEQPTSGAMLLEELRSPPKRTRKTRAASTSRRGRAPPLTKEPSLSHSVPGAFIPDEEEDSVPPLPATPAPRRQTRKTRSKAEESASKESAPRQTRRSSRLSVVSSAGESSPEPPSPERRTRSKPVTRQSTSSGPARPSRSKKQR